MLNENHAKEEEHYHELKTRKLPTILTSSGLM